MLNRLVDRGVSMQTDAIPHVKSAPSRYDRNARDDFPKAIEYLYEFVDKLQKLHPDCAEIIEHILQKQKY